MMEEIKLEQVKNILDIFSKTINWSVGLIFTLILAISNESNTIVLLGIETSKQYIALFIFLILSGINYQILHSLQNLYSTLLDLGSDSLQKARIRITSFPSVFNPFSTTKGSFSFITNYFGYCLLLIIWWIGTHAGLFFLRKIDLTDWQLIMGIILFSFYLILGLSSMTLIAKILDVTISNKKIIRIKNVMTIISILLYGIIPFIIY